MTRNPDRRPQLSPNELHVWRLRLDRPASPLDRLSKLLSPAECERAARFLQNRDRNRYFVGHAGLRSILGTYLDMSPDRVPITIRADGKPEIEAASNPAALCFNLSHSEDLQMVALAVNREVGIDVEQVRSVTDIADIVERFFAPGERAAWRTLSGDERRLAFFRCWTRKEAYLKARGLGLVSGLDGFEVSLAPGEPARLISCSDLGESLSHWQIYDLSAAEEYVAACVVEQGIDKIVEQDWP